MEATVEQNCSAFEAEDVAAASDFTAAAERSELQVVAIIVHQLRVGRTALLPDQRHSRRGWAMVEAAEM